MLLASTRNRGMDRGECPHPPASCRVVSDLHLFTRRSEADRHQESLRDAIRTSETLVLAGDIFDFRWSRFGDATRTALEAERWLEALLSHGPSTQLHYVLGNHDHSPALIERLESLARSTSRFSWHPYHLRLGNAVFLHGDACNPGMTHQRLEAYRQKFAHPVPASEPAQRLYGAAVALRLHTIGARLMFRERAVLRRLTAHLEALAPEWNDEVRNVYFGHTHLTLDGVEHAGRRFHNCGSPMRGLSFRIVEADLS